MIHVTTIKGTWRTFLVVDDSVLRAREREPPTVVTLECDGCGLTAPERAGTIKSYGATEMCAECVRAALGRKRRR